MQKLQTALSKCKTVLVIVVPNFVFHLSQVYALLRQYSVPLGKHDFNGYYQY